MVSYLMKLISGILAILLLVFVPLVCHISIDEIATARRNWNAVENYIDIVCDKGLLTQDDYSDFVKTLGISGAVYEVEIEILRKIALPETEGMAKIIYQPVGFYSSSPNEEYQILSGTKGLNQGDIVSVKCTPISKTTGALMLSHLTKTNTGNEVLSLSSMVRNEGIGDTSL